MHQYQLPTDDAAPHLKPWESERVTDSIGRRKSPAGMSPLPVTVRMLTLGASMLLTVLHAVDGAVYRLLDKKGTYSQGRQNCQAKCLDLAKVTSQQELEQMNAYFNKTKGRLSWLGAHYNGTSFTWADGEPMVVTNWAPNHPKHARTNKCVAVSRASRTWYTWNCEKPLSPLCGKKELQCKVTIYSMTTWKQGRRIPATPISSMRQISHSACARQCLKVKTCTHFLMTETRCELYNDNSAHKTSKTTDLVVWKIN